MQVEPLKSKSKLLNEDTTEADTQISAETELGGGLEELKQRLGYKDNDTLALTNTHEVAFGEYNVNDLISSNVYRQLSSSDQQKCVGEEITLNFDPNVLILDTTSNIVNEAVVGNTDINGVSYVNNLIFYVEPVSTKIVKFYKTNVSNNYTYPYNNNSSIVQVSFSN